MSAISSTAAAVRRSRIPGILRRARILSATSFVALLFALAGTARAQTWNEVGDAGPLPGTAQTTVGTGSLSTLNGNLSSPSDVDMYCIDVQTTAGFFAGLQCVVIQGPNIWLFDAAGNGVAANSMCSSGSKRILNTFVTGAGKYFVAVAYNGVDPHSGAGAIWVPANTGERAPDGPGAAGAVTSWQGTGNVQPLNPYQILFSSTGFCAAPTPSVPETWGRVKALYF